MITAFSQLLKRHHPVINVIPTGEQFIHMISGMPVTGIFGIDCKVPVMQLGAILQLFATQSPAVAKVAIMLIGDITILPMKEQQIITQLAIPTLTLPLQEAPLLALITQLEDELAAP